MKLQEICVPRYISKFDKAKTPMLVPSFSSEGFHNIKDIYVKLSEQLIEYSLISAFDLHSNLIPANLYSSEFIFIDSGGYEMRKLKEIYKGLDIQSQWTPKMYKEVLNTIQLFDSKIIIVNYDPLENDVLDKQFEHASDLFSRYPEFASDFLCKPEKNDNWIDIDKVISNIDKLFSFDILGFTEKELGDSIENRCNNIVLIRRTLMENNKNIPIHIFGCSDPLSILVYFLCGADIFDGLLWQRSIFCDKTGFPIYLKSFAICEGKWAIQDERLKYLYCGINLVVC